MQFSLGATCNRGKIYNVTDCNRRILYKNHNNALCKHGFQFHLIHRTLTQLQRYPDCFSAWISSIVVVSVCHYCFARYIVFVCLLYIFMSKVIKIANLTQTQTHSTFNDAYKIVFNNNAYSLHQCFIECHVIIKNTSCLLQYKRRERERVSTEGTELQAFNI